MTRRRMVVNGLSVAIILVLALLWFWPDRSWFTFGEVSQPTCPPGTPEVNCPDL